jgi:signal transduction histidine kinase
MNFRLPRLQNLRCSAANGRVIGPDQIDWSQLWNPGPVRVFTVEELRLAAQDGPSRTLVVSVLINIALIAWVVLQVAPAPLTAVLSGLMAGGSVGVLALARRLWSRPERRLLTRFNFTLMGAGLVLGMAVALTPRWSDPTHERWVFGTVWMMAVAATMGLWFLAVFRSEQIAGRLREHAEREQAVEMARQLAAAQIQPHFLFNSLASLQHWVQTKDDRAAPMLDSLTGFLRATLPLFNQARLRLGDEAEAVRRYLQVVQLRLGERLRFGIDIDPAAAELQVPPGVLLTLVENAVEHGVQASLHGGEVRVQARVEAGCTVITVHDTGPGLAPGAAEGVGLGNSRARLAQAYGAQAALQLLPGEAGGCTARVVLPAAAGPVS